MTQERILLRKLLPHSIFHLELMIGSVSVVPLFLLPLRFLLRISNLPVVPPLPRKLTARSCSAASLGDVPLTGFRLNQVFVHPFSNQIHALGLSPSFGRSPNSIIHFEFRILIHRWKFFYDGINWLFCLFNDPFP